MLIDNTLEANRVYAAKLAATTDTFFKESLQQLAYSAGEIADHMDDGDRLYRETRRIGLQNRSFNTISIVDEHGVVKAAFPDIFQWIGHKVTTAGVRQALQEKDLLISSPYVSVVNNLIVLVSAPIFSRDGRYQGFIGGSIHLEKPSILNALLDQHFYQDGSYIYVTDHFRKILYHQDPHQIGVIAHTSPIVDSHTESDGSRKMGINRVKKCWSDTPWFPPAVGKCWCCAQRVKH